ncbi:MAG: endonuclease/exonuclease/phosphatase family protein [Fimbriimonas sp.]
MSLALLCIATVAAPLSVMSFNVRYGTAPDGEDRWEVRKGRVRTFLEKRRPELVGLQEALVYQIEDMRTALKGYQAVGVGRDDGKEGSEFSAILYDPTRLRLMRSDTFWLSETPQVPGSKHWGNNPPRICTWAFFKDIRTGKYLYHFNTHLDHRAQESREKGMALILRSIKDRPTPDPAILTGDLNAGESNPVVKLIADAGLRDSFRLLHPNAPNAGTFHGFKETLNAEKIDFIFIGPGWRVASAEHLMDKVGGRWVSDHLPVIASLVAE